MGTRGWLQPPSHGELRSLVLQNGRIVEKGQEERGARAGRAGLSDYCHPCTVRTTSFGPADQKLCPVAKAGGHSLGLRIRCHISALAYSQDNFLEANGSLRAPLRSQEFQSFFRQSRLEFTSGFRAVYECFLTINQAHIEFNPLPRTISSLWY